MTLRKSSLAGWAACLVAATAHGGDWPQWRGPNWDGSADEMGLPATFSDTQNIAWTAALPGPSGATPIIVGQRVFIVSTAKGGVDLMGLCFDLSDGKLLWSHRLGRGGRVPRTILANCSPVADGRRVVFTFGSGEMAGLDFDGKVLWQRDLTRDFGCLAIMFGFASSPLLYEGRLHLPVQRREKPYSYNLGADLPRQGALDCFLLCVDPASGRDLWRHVRATDAVDESREAYTTPVPCELAGRKEVIVNGGVYVTGHDPATGRELWRWRYDVPARPTQQRVIPSAVVGEGLIFAPQARGEALYALRGGADGTVPHRQHVWKFGGLTCDASTPLVYRGRLYVLDGDEKVMSCLEPATGRIVWQEKVGGTGPWRASPTGADGRIYCLSEGGDVLVLAAGDRYQELARVPLGSSPCHSSIAAAAGRLFIRTADRLICLRKEGAGN